ncbi:MAG: hypothetical protein F4087_09135 [Gemmatimonadetes bacterium]|nr:hypothetical protein [Gemmatimonadota bacterium]MYE71060.1 hypothetical protein [Gemmatimonadota bacterium]MYJ68653.1 hypothetical protein [Gemmatimonadota bacterium]
MRFERAVHAALCGLAVAWAGCAPPPAPPEAARPVTGERPAGAVEPERSGSLRQDQISVRLAAGVLLIEVTPLAAWVLEAAAPDTRDRLRRIADTHGAVAARRSGALDPSLFLVSFTSRQPGAEFQPDDLHLVSRGLRERPAAIRAITPGWGSHRLEQQATAQAVYAYPGGVDLTRELTVVYQDTEVSSWSSRLAVIEAERARIGRPRGSPRGVAASRPGVLSAGYQPSRSPSRP